MRQILTILFLMLAIGYCTYDTTEKKMAKQNVPKTREQIIESAFSGYDGSHRELTKEIKARLRDPSSYEHIETKFKDDGNKVIVICRYRAKNGFGGMTPGMVIAHADLDGKGVVIKSQE